MATADVYGRRVQELRPRLVVDQRFNPPRALPLASWRPLAEPSP
jgi:hypothetical protein